MIARDALATLRRLEAGFPIIGITGPRQSGKTTLARAAWPDRPYVSLEDPDSREYAESDPRAFLSEFDSGVILDEVQRVPKLFSYLQAVADSPGPMGRIVLTGSQQFDLRAGITQSLAGRVALLSLLPFSVSELHHAGCLATSPKAALFSGFYPPLYDRPVEPRDWFPAYMATYLERDLHQILQVRDLRTFQVFLRMCAARTGSILNLSSLALDCGVSTNTAKAWISVLEASYIIHLLSPHHRNFNKRLTKSPKLFFFDTGLAAYLLGIETPEQLWTHPMRGGLFETYVVSELLKQRYNDGRRSNLFFWRDRTGHEVDVIIENSLQLLPVEVKSGATIQPEFFSNLRYWSELAGNEAGPARVVYAGNSKQTRRDIEVLPWNQIGVE